MLWIGRAQRLVVIGMVLAVIPTGVNARNSKPEAAPSTYSALTYGLTFQTPKNASYCPRRTLDMDHGTTLFLIMPPACSKRAERTPSINIFYAYWMDEDEPPNPTCRPLGVAKMFGRSTRLCGFVWRGMKGVWVQRKFDATPEAKVSFSLTTTTARFDADLATFKALLATVRTCTATWGDAKHPPQFTVGVGPPCPDNGDIF